MLRVAGNTCKCKVFSREILQVLHVLAVFGLGLLRDTAIVVLAVFQESILRILPYSQYSGFNAVDYFFCARSILGFDTLE